MLTLLLACAGPEIETVTEDTYKPVTSGGLDCDSLDIAADGDDPPHVGSTWTVLLWCDDTLMTGTTRLTVSPSEAASVDSETTELTFLVAGDVDITMQVGTYKATETVTVLE